MTPEIFFTTFQKHLCVGEPKRSEILAETRSHLDQSRNLGNPKELAKELNRVHLGLLCSPSRLAFLITATVLFTLAAGVLFEAHAGFWSRRLPDGEIWASMMYYYSFFAPVIVAGMIGRAIGQMHNARALFFRLWILAFFLSAFGGIAHNFVIGVTDLDIPDTLTGIVWSSVFSSIFLTTVYSAAAFVGLVTRSLPHHDPHGKLRRWQANFSAISSALFLFFLIITTWTALVFQPIPHPAVWPVMVVAIFIVFRVTRKVRNAYL